MNKELLTVLQKVQKEMPVIGRDTTAFKYKYAPIDTVWNNISKVIIENGFVIINEVQETGLLTLAIHEHGELKSFIKFSTLDLKPQERGSEITYYRRYNLTAIFNVIIADEDDDAYITTLDKETPKNENKGQKTPLEIFKDSQTYENYLKLQEADKIRFKTALCKKLDLPFVDEAQIKQHLK